MTVVNRVDVSSVLARYRDRSANYGEAALFDHLPMGVAALAQMGSDQARIADWARRYADRHQLRPASDRECEGRARWRARIRADGRGAVIAAHAARLADGIGAAAFHAAIRAAYAVERADDDELAAALEAWEREYLALPHPPFRGFVSVSQALTALAAEPIRADGGGLIATRMAVVARQPRFATIAAEVPAAADIDALALAAAAAFAQSRNFTALHVMTATHALRTLVPLLSDEAAIMPGFWCAYAAAALVAEAVPTIEPAILEELRADAPPDWEPLLARAVALDDEHVIKSTYTAWQLDRALNDAVFRTAANRYLLACAS